MAITLTKEQVTAVNNALAAIKAAKTEILRAKQAGISVEAEETAMLEQEGRLLAIKRGYIIARA